MKPSPARLALCCALALVCPKTAFASWAPDGVLVVDGPGLRDVPKIVTDGAGGAYITWREYRGSSGADVYLQRITAAGTIAPGWLTTALPLCTAPDDQLDRVLAPDGSGGAYVAWVDYRDRATNNADIYILRALADGSVAPGWPTNGLAVVALPGVQRFPVLALDGTGGVFVAWQDLRGGAGTTDVYMQRIGPGGAIAPGWPINGRGVATAPGEQLGPSIAGDGTGGTFLAWGDTRNFGATMTDIYGIRVDSDGNPRLGWAVNGNPICTFPGVQGITHVLLDPDGGVFVGFDDFRNALPNDPFEESQRDIYCTRMTGSGATHLGWPADGLAICTAPQTQQGLQLASDGAGGIYLAWQDNRDSDYDVYLQHVRPDATLWPGWPADGLRPLPSLLGFQLHPHLAPDAVDGVYLSIENLTDIHQVHTQHVTGTGAIAPGWPSSGQPASSIETDEDESAITPDGFGGAIVVWKDFRNQKDDLYATRLMPLGPTATLLSLLSSEADPDRVRLAWHVTSGTVAEARVERQSAGEEWREVGLVRPDESGRLAFEDTDVVPGSRYGYRLAYSEDGGVTYTAEAWLDVPVRYELALAGLRPNPSTRGDLTIAFTLPDAALATLDLIDVTGRRVASRAVGTLGAGRHTLRLDEGRAIATGVYWVRLAHPSRTLTARAVLID